MEKTLSQMTQLYCLADAAMTEGYTDLANLKYRIKRSTDRYNTLTAMDAPRIMLTFEWNNLKNLREQADLVQEQVKGYSALRQYFKKQLETKGVNAYTPDPEGEKIILNVVSSKGYNLAEALKEVYQQAELAQKYAALYMAYKFLELGMPDAIAI